MEGPRFILRLGPNNNLKVDIKKTVDVPGQYAAPLADETFRNRPHALVIMLDLSKPLHGDDENHASAVWLNEFCKRLDQKWHTGKQKRNRLRSVIVAMNKKDLVGDGVVESSRQAFKKIVDQHWKASRGPKMQDVRIKPCISVENPEGRSYVDAILVDLGKALIAKG